MYLVQNIKTDKYVPAIVSVRFTKQRVESWHLFISKKAAKNHVKLLNPVGKRLYRVVPVEVTIDTDKLYKRVTK